MSDAATPTATTYQPLHDRVLVRIPRAEDKPMAKTSGGLYVPTAVSARNSPLQEAVVVAVGEGPPLADGTTGFMTVEPGDRVLLDMADVLQLPSRDPTLPIEGVIYERQIIVVIR